MLKKINELTFLEDITEELGYERVDMPSVDMPKLFKDSYKVFRVKDCHNVLFKIASDWEGNWLAGSWYVNEQKITNPDELLDHLSRADIVTLAFHLDILDEISSWKRDKFINGEHK